MRLLLVAATAAEIEPLVVRLGGAAPLQRLTSFSSARHQLDVLVTGVGMVAAATWCARTLAQSRPDAALNLGVCGSFNSAFEPGSVVHVVSEELPELGAEDGDRFLTLSDLGLVGADGAYFDDGRLTNRLPLTSATLDALPTARGITVNTVHGHDVSIARVVERTRPDVESMEGAAFVYACLTADVPFAQVRAVSNRVERRNRSAWKIPEALQALTRTVESIVGDL